MALIAYYLGTKQDNPTTTFLDRLICFVTRARYSHVELITQYDPETRTGLSYSSSPRDGGVRVTNIVYNPSSWEIYKLETTIDDEQITTWYNKYLGAKYDWIGAIGAWIKWVPENKQRWFCSESIATVLNLPNAHRLTPQKLFETLNNHERIL